MNFMKTHRDDDDEKKKYFHFMKLKISLRRCDLYVIGKIKKKKVGVKWRARLYILYFI